MNPSNEERAALRKLLQARLNGKVTGFQDAHLNAMLKQGLSTEARLAIASWSELSALLPRVLVHTLLAAYNSSALNGPGVCSTRFANFAKLLLPYPSQIIPGVASLRVQGYATFIPVFWLICRHTREANGWVQARFLSVWCVHWTPCIIWVLEIITLCTSVLMVTSFAAPLFDCLSLQAGNAYPTAFMWPTLW